MGKLYIESSRPGPVSVSLKKENMPHPYKTVHLQNGLNEVDGDDWAVMQKVPMVQGLMKDGLLKESAVKPKGEAKAPEAPKPQPKPKAKPEPKEPEDD